MEAIFQQSGNTVFTALSGKEGFEIAKNNLLDVILIDLAMPEMDGFEAKRLLKKDPATSKITVIACSAFAMEEFREKAFWVGCEGYITKPIKPKELIEQVKMLVLASKIKRRLLWEKSYS